jgi:hypothetical protein
VPIQAGGRLTGRVGAFTLGLVNIETGRVDAGADARAVAATNFSIVRVKRDILRRSAIGAMFTRRSVGVDTPGANETYGVDGSFAFFENLSLNVYWAKTRTPGVTTNDTSNRFHFRYEGDRFGGTVHHLTVGEGFNPEVGFSARRDINREFLQLRFSPRPTGIESIRKFFFQGQLKYIEDLAGQLETRELEGRFAIEFENSDRFEVQYADAFEYLDRGFEIATGVEIPSGSFDFGTWRVQHELGQQRPVSGQFSVERGTFFGGHKTVVGYTQGRVELTPQLAVAPTISLNRVTLPYGSFTTNLVGSRLTYTATPLMFVSGLVQYNSARRSVDANVRLRWEYQPGSELFVVYNETRDTERAGFPGFESRAIIVKVNRLFRF